MNQFLISGWCAHSVNENTPEEVLKQLTFFTCLVMKGPFHSHFQHLNLCTLGEGLFDMPLNDGCSE